MITTRLRNARILEEYGRDLVAEVYDDSIGLYRPTRIILDLIIGSRNGKLEIGGSGFSKSTIERDFIDDDLKYICKIYTGKRKSVVTSELLLTDYLEPHNGQFRIKNERLRRRYERDLSIAEEIGPSLEFRFRESRVDERGRMTTELWNSEARIWRPASLPLNDLLGNDNSRYMWGGQGFAEHILGTPKLEGMVLCSHLLDSRGEEHGLKKFDLGPHYTVIKGQFVLRDGTSDPQGSWLELPRAGASEQERTRWEQEAKARFMRKYYPELARRIEYAQKEFDKKKDMGVATLGKRPKW